MKMKLFFAAMAVTFGLGVVTSCGNKKAAASAEETTEKVCDSTKTCCKDSLACDSTKAACCGEKAE